VAQLLALADRERRRLLVLAVQPLEEIDGAGAGDAVDAQADVELELAQRLEGLQAVEPVLVAGVEPEPVQPALQVADVVAVQQRPGDVEHPVAQAERGAVQRVPGVVADDPVRRQPPLLLEGADRGPGGIAEHACVVVAGEPERVETLLDVLDLGTDRAVLDEVHDAGA